MNDKKLVMYLDDSSLYGRNAKRCFGNFDFKNTELETFDNFIDLESAMAKQVPVLLILDNDLSGEELNGKTKGIDLVPKYKKMYPELVIVHYSAYMDPEDQQRSIDNGATHIFDKELGFENVISTCLEFIQD